MIRRIRPSPGNKDIRPVSFLRSGKKRHPHISIRKKQLFLQPEQSRNETKWTGLRIFLPNIRPFKPSSVLSLISVFGMMLGKVRFFGISLGVTFVFFIGIAAGHFGLSVDPSMLAFAESFGLVLFVYALGLQVGPGFFSSLRSGGIRLVSLATLIVLTGSALAVGSAMRPVFP